MIGVSFSLGEKGYPARDGGDRTLLPGGTTTIRHRRAPVGAGDGEWPRVTATYTLPDEGSTRIAVTTDRPVSSTVVVLPKDDRAGGIRHGR